MNRYNWRPPTEERVPINIHPEVRDMLRHLLMTEFAGTGIGYSAFIYRAVKDASAKWHEERNQSRPYGANLPYDQRDFDEWSKRNMEARRGY